MKREAFRKKILVIVLLSMCILALAGCGKEEQPSVPNPADENEGNGEEGAEQRGEGDSSVSVSGQGTEEDPSSHEESVVQRFRLVDGAETGSLVLASEEGYDVYTLFAGETPVYVNGSEADASALKDGMVVDIAFSGDVMESFPAQLGQVYSISAYGPGTRENPAGGYYDLCGLYLQVLNDLWDRDSGLNSGITMVSVDLSQAPGDLTEGEKQAVAWIFACQHNVEMLTMSYEELAEEGYLTEMASGGTNKLYQWDEGVLFSITAGTWEDNEFYSLPVIKFNAEKWRSPLGAYFFGNCSALWPEMGTWSNYEIGDEAIS